MLLHGWEGKKSVWDPNHRMLFIEVFRVPCDEDAPFAVCRSPNHSVGKFEPVLSSRLDSKVRDSRGEFNDSHGLQKPLGGCYFGLGVCPTHNFHPRDHRIAEVVVTFDLLSSPRVPLEKINQHVAVQDRSHLSHSARAASTYSLLFNFLPAQAPKAFARGLKFWVERASRTARRTASAREIRSR